VDQAGLISAPVESRLTTKLIEHENATTNQVVVVTLSSLHGYTIEDFGYRLGRHWAIGQKDRNNGVLLIVAPDERKVRIEVGYGLEGALPDVLAKRIIEREILPEFRKDRYEAGIVAGTGAILSAIAGEYRAVKKVGGEDRVAFYLAVAFLIFCFLVVLSGLILNLRHGFILEGVSFFAGGVSAGSSGRSSRGSFSGGGGSFGGGGSSGSW